MEIFSPGHLIVLAVVVAVLFFGWKQLPDMSRSLGRSLRILKTEIKGMTDDDKARDEQAAHPGSADDQQAKAVEAAPDRPAIRAAAPVSTAKAAAPARPAARPVAQPTPRPAAAPAATARPRPTPKPGSRVGSGSGSAT